MPLNTIRYNAKIRLLYLLLPYPVYLYKLHHLQHLNIHSPNENLGWICIGLGFCILVGGFIKGRVFVCWLDVELPMINAVTRFTFKRVKHNY